jgi:hypothetical protein
VTLVAGVDIGNATTEVVLGEVRGDTVTVVATGRAPTRRWKGSPASLDGAATLVHRLERQHDVRVQAGAIAPLRPVETTTALMPESQASTGRLWVVKADAQTAGGGGVGVGRPMLLGTAVTGSDPVVVVVPRRIGFASAAPDLAALDRTGRLAAVLVEADEGVLIANRLGGGVPVIDEVDVGAVLGADRVAVEVSADGRPLQRLTDALKLWTSFDLSAEERDDAAHLAPLLLDSTNAVVASGGAPLAADRGAAGWIEVGGSGRLPFLAGHRRIREGLVGAGRAYALPPLEEQHQVDDLWTVDLAAVATTVQARRGSARSRPVTFSALRSDAPSADPSTALSDRLQVPVQSVVSEATAARAGGLSTPGSLADTVVVDLGGGTIDAVSPGAAVTAAGGGELLTASVAALTGATSAAAEWVKRGPAHRVDAPQVLMAEDGSRGFLDQPAPRETIGSLVIRGPAGLLRFSSTMAPGEWRALRRQLKEDVLGSNVARALRTLDEPPRSIVVVGGPAGDEEVLAAVGGALRPGTAVGRGEVAGSLGHRYAVAYGLLLLVAR